jgi:DNA-directed RNA polymerase I, II, and III subunit RPABC2
MSSIAPVPSPPLSRNTVKKPDDDDYEGDAITDDETNDTSTNASDTEESESSSSDDRSDITDNDDDSSSEVADEGPGKKVSDRDGDGDGGGGREGGDDSEDDEPRNKKNKKKSLSGKGNKHSEDNLTLLGVPHGIFGNDDDEDNEDSDEDDDPDSSEYFQKLASTVRESYVETYHPETMSHNYDEIQTLARVVRNSDGVIVDDLHRTIPIMTKYEKTRILGQRAKQLNEGAPAFIKIDSTVIDGYLIAVKELEQKKTPFIIRRPLPNGGSEYWRVQDLEIL